MVSRAGQHRRWPIRDVLTAVLVIFLHPCVAQSPGCVDVSDVSKTRWIARLSDSFKYSNEKSCTWNITVDEGYTILVRFGLRQTQWSPDCRREYFKFYDGVTPSNGTLLGTSCSATSVVESSSNVLWTEFYTDRTAEYGYAEVEYYAVNETNECRTIDLKDSEGSFQIQDSVRRNGACVWNITAEEGFNILLRIMEYSLSYRYGSLCNTSLLKVYDGNKEDESLLVRSACSGVYNRNRLQSGLVVSTTNSLLVVLTIQENSGFSIVDLRASYNAVNAAIINRNCGGNVTGNEGNITSPNYPDNYDNLTTCKWFITVDPAYNVQFHINYSYNPYIDDYSSSFFCSSDLLMVEDGYGRLVKTICTDYPYFNYRPDMALRGRLGVKQTNKQTNYYNYGNTYGNRAIVTFTTDQEGTNSSFTMHWYSVCERTWDFYRDGTLQSPNYPDNYPGNLSCVYSTGSSAGYSMVISFHNFELEGPSSNGLCAYDYLEVDYRYSPVWTLGMEGRQRFCGDNIPSTLTLYPPVVIRFVTDLNNSRSGYQASYEFFEADCGQLLFTGETGTITSPNYPGTFPSYIECTYVILVEPGQTIYLAFDHLTLVRSRWVFETQGPNCNSSFSRWPTMAVLSVFDGEVSADNVSAANDNLIDIFCGNRAPSPVSSTRSAMTLFFAAGPNYNLRGFSATYTAIGNTSIFSDCGGELSGQGGQIVSPNYPEHYPNNSICAWTITGRQGDRVRVKFSHFDLEDSADCQRDSVEFRDGPDETGNRLDRVCGNTLPFDVTSRGNVMHVTFLADLQISRSGFNITWVSLCEETLRAPSGTIQSKAVINGSRECTYIIEQVWPGYVVQLDFQEFHLGDTNNCQKNYIEVRNGGYEGSPLLGQRYCGSNRPPQLKSTQGMMWIRYVIKDSNAGFVANFSRQHLQSDEFTRQLSLYPYGLVNGDSKLPQNHDEVKEVPLDTGFPIGNKLQYTLFVANKGLVSFGKPEQGKQLTLKSDKAMISPYHSDIGAWGSNGGVYYQVYTDNKEVLDKASNEIREFTEHRQYTASLVVVVTWDHVAHISSHNASKEQATVQLALISDGRQSYGLVYYKKGEMKWSMLDNQPLIIGFSDGQKDKPFYSMYSNTTEAFTQLDRIKGNTGRYGMWLYTLGDSYSPDQKCQDWYKQNLRLKEERLTAFQRLPQCPCNTRFLWGNWRFSHWRDGYKVRCFRMNLGSSRQFAPHGKECCYKVDGRWWGWWRSFPPFITDPPYAGSVTAFNPAFWSLQADYQREDRQAHDVCCYNTTNDRYCNMFYELRPVGKCSIKIPFGVTATWGDPHVKTLDGKEYTFNGWGEYTMITLTSGNLTFSLQGRTGLAETESGSITNATVFTAFAAEENGIRVFVGLDPNTNESLIIYGNDTDYSRAFRDAGDDDVLVDSEAYMLKRSNESFVVTFASEIQMTILIGYKSLDIFMSIPLQYRNLTKGLLGNFNGVKDDDFVLPGGTSLNSDLTDRQIYEEFGPTWAVTASNSVLRYGPREGPADFAHPEFSPIFLDEVAMDTRQAAEDLCGPTNVACIYDYIATGSAAIANASGNTAIIAEEREKVTQNTVPVLNFNGTVQVTSGQIVSFNLQGHDPDTKDVLTYYVLADDEGNLQIDSRTGDVSLTADYKKPVSFSFYTTDSQNVQSPVRDLKLVMCSGCTNHGTCDFSRTTSSGVTGFLIAACDCNPAWTGDHCDQDYDACDESPCDVHQVCTDLTPDQQGGNDVGFNCSGCPEGFYTDPTDSTRCMDKDECTQQSNCNQLCTNLPGSFSCTCNDGYRLSSDDVSCDDINECAEKRDGCQQQCVNTEGSYRCQCYPGYTLSERATCIADSTTADLCSRARCDHACTATTDSSDNTIQHCFCFNGYKLDPANNRSCVDRDECSEGVCSQSCTNTQGSFACTCYTGHVMSSDQRTCNPCPKLRYGPECRHTCECSGRGLSCHPVTGCVCQSGWTGSQCQDDVNECEESPDVCGEGKRCVNNNGSYICLCPDGYAKDSEGVCQDIDECAEETVSNTCGELEQCHNVPGSFYCTCRSGYTLIYGQCTDVDECSSSSLNQCQQLCHNVPGDYNCDCRYGYRLNLDRVSCSPVADVCAEFEGLNCDHGCSLNDDERAFCFCWLGYVLGPNLQSCQDVNECENSPCGHQCENSPCEHQCENSPGSYRCLCNRGFSLDTTSGDCIDINECAVSVTNECTQRCDNTPGSYRCSCDVTGYVLDNDGFTCSAKSALVRVAMTVTVQITAPPDLFNPDGTTNAFWGKMVEDALYNKLKPDVPGLEAVIVVSLRPGSLIIDSVVVVNNETHPYSTSNLTFALMNMVQGQITINNQTGNISLTVGSVTVDASARACDVYEQIATCSSGYQCMMQGGSLSCRQIPQNEDGDQVLLIAVVVSAVVLVIVVVIIVIVCIKRKKAARKRAMPVHLADLNKETAMSGKTG